MYIAAGSADRGCSHLLNLFTHLSTADDLSNLFALPYGRLVVFGSNDIDHLVGLEPTTASLIHDPNTT